MTLNGFDRIAFMYDFLARLVFGKSIVDSQKYFLNNIQDHAKVLILGGGSGWLLAELLRIKPNCEVWYIEASEKMMASSMNSVGGKHSVHFIHGTEQNIPVTIQFDAVITNFYLDLFTHHHLEAAIEKIRSSLNSGALWIATDFIDSNKHWQRMLLRVMYWFFSMTCYIEPRQLPEWNKLLKKAGFKEVESKTFYGDFIKTVRLLG